MQIETLIEVVECLIGDINPIGDSIHDKDVYYNLQNATKLIRHLVEKLDEIELYNQNASEYSRVVCAELISCSKKF